MAKKLRFLFTLLFIMAATLSWGEEKKATLTINPNLDISESVNDDDGNIWTITTDHKAPSTSKGYIQAGSNKVSVSYIKLISSSFNEKKVKQIQVWGTSKANTNVTTKISIGETLLGTSSVYTEQNADNGGTEFSVENTNNVDGVITILISRPTSTTGAIYFNKAIITYEEEGGTPVTVSAPTFTLAGGTYAGEQEVAINTATDGATIFYTTDSTTPTNESEEYSTPLTISETTTVKAIAYKDGESSEVAEATYTIIPAGAENVTLWSEDFSSYSAGNIPSGGIYSYSCSGTGTKIYTDDLAGGASPELLVAKSGGTFTAVVPLKSVVGDLTLAYKTNANKLEVSTTTDGITGGGTFNTAGIHTVVFKNITLQTKSITIVFTAPDGKNVRLDDIGLTGLQIPTAVKTPTFSLVGGTYFGARSVEISCATTDATIYYSTDGDNWTEYSSPIAIEQTTTLYAKAVKDEDVSDVATATYTIAPVYANCQAANEAAAKDEVSTRLSLTEALVVYKKGQSTYVKDATGGMLIYGNTDLVVGNKVTGYIEGSLLTYNGLPEIKPTEVNVEVVSSNNAVEPTLVSASDFKAKPLNYVNQYIAVKPAVFESDYASSSSDVTNTNFTVGKTELVLRNNFKLAFNVSAEKMYYVAGMATIYEKDNNTAVQVYPTNAETDIVEIPVVAQIGDVKYETLADAVAAATDGQTVKVIKSGEYTLPNLPKNITIEGAADGVVSFTHTAAGSIASIPNGATFKNVKFEFGNVNYHGFQHAGTINMEGCTLSGKFFSYGDMNFTNCQFTQTNSDYHMWTYAGNVTYTNCTFTNEKTGKFINVYNESGATKYTVTATNCKFINKEGNAANKAAINVKATSKSNLLTYDVIINNCTTEGAFPEANVTQALAILNGLVQVDDRTANGVDNITVTQDGEQIYPIKNYVAQIGEVKYETLKKALDAAKDNENIVVELLADAELDITAWSGENNSLAIGSINTKSITINGNNHTLTFNHKNSDWSNVATKNDAETKLILNNMKITNGGYNDSGWNRHDINFNCAVELNNVTSDKALAFKNDATLKNVTINDNGSNSVDDKISEYYGIWISPRKAGQNISIDGLTVTCARGIKVDDEYVDNPEKVTLDIKNATFNTTKKSAILVKSKAETAITVGEDVNIANVAADKVNTVWVDEDYADEFYKVAVEGATVVPESKEADYDACLMKGEQRWGFYKKVSSAIEKVEDGYSIKLFRTTTEAVSVVRTLTIVKNGFTADNVVAGEGFVRIETDTEIKIISASAVPTTPVVFHDSGEYEAGLSVPMYAQAGEIYYTINGGTKTKYTAPLTVSEKTTVVAWTEIDGVESEKVTKTFTIVTKAEAPSVEEGYYSIKNGTGKYINVAGRKTVTFTDAIDDKAGTVIKVKTNDKGQVEVLRSQGVDLPGYADRAMNYVPKFVKLVVEKLHAAGSGEILGEHGLDAIMQKFNDSFDYHLYIENAKGNANAGYRIYGKTPSMKPVVDFYAENKANVDIKLPKLEEFINSAIDKVLEKTGGRGQSILVDFSLKTVWEKMGKTLTEPKDEASTAKFYEEVLSSEANVWNFAYQTAMIYWNNVKSHPRYEELKGKLGEYAKYIEKVENIRPDFKYYIVANTAGNDVDFISEGNIDIQNNAARATWTLEKRTDFKVTFNKENSINLGRELYTTLYTDFAYTVPEKVKAYKVTAIDEKTGLATKEEITGVIPAQTPVLLQMIVDPKTVTDADLTQTLTLSTEAGTAVTGNLLQGPDWLINKYQIKAKQVEELFGYVHDFLKLADVEALYDSYVKEYEYLMIRNAGTVNNKYFFGLSGDDIAVAVVNVCQLAKQGNPRQRLAFYHNLGKVEANKAFIPSETIDTVYLSLIGDVNRDGSVDIEDVTCQIDIVLGKDKPSDNYDYDAADLDFNEDVTISDVTDLIDVVLGKKTIE